MKRHLIEPPPLEKGDRGGFLCASGAFLGAGDPCEGHERLLDHQHWPLGLMPPDRCGVKPPARMTIDGFSDNHLAI